VRTIYVTGGFSGNAVVDLADSEASLVGATFKACLRPEGTETPPAVGNAAWLTPVVTDQTDPAAVITQLVDNTITPGFYNLAVDVIEGGRHEVVWAKDADNTDRRALIQVT
jgi:hypothetical protein